MTHREDVTERDMLARRDAHAEHGVAGALLFARPPGGASGRETSRRRGRPLEMPPDAVLAEIRRMAQGEGLFRVHRNSPPLYARARRLFGSWSAAVQAAGLDYRAAVEEARRRSVQSRQERRERRA